MTVKVSVPPAIDECFRYCTSLPAKAIICFTDFGHLNDVRRNLKVILICISLISKDVFLSHLSFLFEDFLFKFVSHFYVGLFVSLIPKFLSTLYTLNLRFQILLDL